MEESMNVKLFRPGVDGKDWFFRFGSCDCGTCAPEQRRGFGFILPHVLGVSVGFGGTNATL